jgi:RNA polymerase II transcription mediator complex subunit 9
MIAKVNELQKKLENMREFVEKLPGIDLSKEEQQRQMEVLRQQLITKTELLKKYKNVDKF